MALSWQNRSGKTQRRHWATRYFYSGWHPAAIFSGLLIVAWSISWSIGLSIVVGGLRAITLIGLISATSWNLMNKRWLQSTLGLCLLICFCYSLNLTLAHQFLFAADDALIPATVAETAPTKVTDTATERSETVKTPTTEESIEPSTMRFYRNRGRSKWQKERE